MHDPLARQKGRLRSWEICVAKYSELDKGSLRRRKEFSETERLNRLNELAFYESKYGVVYPGEHQWLSDSRNLQFSDWISEVFQDLELQCGAGTKRVHTEMDSDPAEFVSFGRTGIEWLAGFERITFRHVEATDFRLDVPASTDAVPSKKHLVLAFDILHDYSDYLRQIDQEFEEPRCEIRPIGVLIEKELPKWSIIFYSQFGAFFDIWFDGRMRTEGP